MWSGFPLSSPHWSTWSVGFDLTVHVKIRLQIYTLRIKMNVDVEMRVEILPIRFKFSFNIFHELAHFSYRLFVTFVSIDCVIMTAFSSSLSNRFLWRAPDDSSQCFRRWCSCSTELVVTFNCEMIFEQYCDVTIRKTKTELINECYFMANKKRTLRTVNVIAVLAGYILKVGWLYGGALHWTSNHAGNATVTLVIDRNATWSWWNSWLTIARRVRLSLFRTWVVLSGRR